MNEGCNGPFYSLVAVLHRKLTLSRWTSEIVSTYSMPKKTRRQPAFFIAEASSRPWNPPVRGTPRRKITPRRLTISELLTSILDILLVREQLMRWKGQMVKIQCEVRLNSYYLRIRTQQFMSEPLNRWCFVLAASLHPRCKNE